MSQIALSLEKKDASYVAGEKIRGSLVLTIDKQLKFTRIGVALTGTERSGIFTGRGRAQREHVFLEKTLDLKKDGILSSGNYKLPFDFDVPKGLPPAYTGVHTQIKYALIGFLDLESLFDKIANVNAEISIKSSPDTKPKQGGAPQNFQSEAHKNKPHFSVSLKETNLPRGEQLKGTLTVANPNNSRISGLKLTLFAIEDLLEYKQTDVAYKSEHKIPASKIVPGVPTNFQIPVPSNKGVTYASAHSKLQWLLEVDLELPWWSHVKVQIPLNVF